jgi:hypothetical protein
MDRSASGLTAAVRHHVYRHDIRSDEPTVNGFHRAAAVVLRALRMACEPEVEEVIAHRVATPLADNGQPVGPLAAARRRVSAVDVNAVASGEPTKADVVIAAGADSSRLQQNSRGDERGVFADRVVERSVRPRVLRARNLREGAKVVASSRSSDV